MRKPSVWVVGNQYAVQNVFSSYGFNVVYNESEAILKGTDLIVFTGGEDVSPKYYGEEKFIKTMCNPGRDVKEMLVFEKNLDRPKVGICRGGQLLNVLSGGKLFQDVNNHRVTHKMIDLLFTKKSFLVPSGHHQMMIPTKEAVVLAVAHEATQFTSCADTPPPKPRYDTEVVWYPKTSSLCYQSHPEWRINDTVNMHIDYFFQLINWAFDLKGSKT